MVHSHEVTERGQETGIVGIAIDDSVRGQQSIDLLLESILTWVMEVVGHDQMVKAKEEFYWKNGKVFHDDPFFNGRMGYFIDYFIFQRPLESSVPSIANESPYEAFRNKSDGVKEDDCDVIGFVHSLFQVTRISGLGILLKDLFSGEKILCRYYESGSFHGFAKKDIFQGFIYKLEDKNLLSRGLVFHPPEVSRLIKSYIKKIRKGDQYEQLRGLSRLARQQLRHLRHSHVKPKKIYNQDP